MKKMLSICAAVALILLGASPLTTSAGYVDDYVGGENGLIRDMLSDTLEQYDLSGVASTTDVTYVFGSYGGWYCTCIWIGSESYRTEIDTTAAVPVPNYYHSSSYACAFNSSYVGHPYMAAFYFDDENDYYRLQSVYTTSPGNYNAIASQRNTHFLSEEAGATIGENVWFIASELVPSDPTEPATSGGFQLPDSWINGGETLAPAEPMTFESVNLDDAMQELENMEYTTPPDVLGAVGAFWYIFDGFVDASGLQWLVITSLVVVLVAWFLGRRV